MVSDPSVCRGGKNEEIFTLKGCMGMGIHWFSNSLINSALGRSVVFLAQKEQCKA